MQTGYTTEEDPYEEGVEILSNGREHTAHINMFEGIIYNCPFDTYDFRTYNMPTNEYREPIQPSDLREVTNIFNDINTFIQNSGDSSKKHIVISLPDLHGAHYTYGHIVSLANLLRENYPGNKIYFIFPGDAAARGDPPFYSKEQQLGNFCTSLLLPLSKIQNVEVVYALGNHDFQNTWKFLNFLMFLKKHNISCITHFKKGINTLYEGIIGTPVQCFDLRSPEFTERLADYDIDEQAVESATVNGKELKPECLKETFISGNTLFFPYCLAWAWYGGGDNQDAPKKIFEDSYYDKLGKIANANSRIPEKLDTDEGQEHIRETAELFRQGIDELINSNSKAKTLNVVIMSHATDEQTEDFLNRMFKLECAQINRNNFKDDADRIKLFVAGGHRHYKFTKTIALNTDGQHVTNVPYCASRDLGQGMHVWLLDDGSVPAAPVEPWTRTVATQTRSVHIPLY
jgi:hypothetical protein